MSTKANDHGPEVCFQLAVVISGGKFNTMRSKTNKLTKIYSRILGLGGLRIYPNDEPSILGELCFS